MAIASVSAASSTSSNWLKEAQDALAASETPGGMMGALQDARSGSSSIKSFLTKSQNNSNALAQIAQSAQISSSTLMVQMSQAAAQKRYDEQVALQVKLNPVHTNYTPPKGLDPVIYFGDGSSVDTTSNIMTLTSGKQIDITTGFEYHDPKDIISMANGAYLDTKNNILTMSDGTKIDTVSGLKITA
jgi:hypothetical protein